MYNVAMVKIDITYEGQLHCQAVHEPSRSVLATDAPKDNMGKGEAFSPTDLVATGLGSCMLTIMGIVAQRQGIDITGTKIEVTKEMATTTPRRIARLAVNIRVPGHLSPDDRQRLENAAHTCPVHRSLHPDIEVPIQFQWAD